MDAETSHAHNGNDDAAPTPAVPVDPGPFAPPADYRFEPELQGQPPRPVPRYLRHGPHAARWKRNAAAAFVAALVCVLLARAGFVREMGQYVRPLEHLSWIGMGLAALTLGIVLLSAIVPGLYAYVRDGIPVIGRILACGTEIVTCKVGGGTVQKFHFVVDAEFVNPETGQHERRQIRTPDIDDPAKMARYKLPFEVGGYVTLIYRPGDLEKSLRIYRLLGLNPDIPFIQKDGKTWVSGLTVSAAVLVVLGVMAFLTLGVGVLYAFDFLQPLDAGRRFVLMLLPVGAAIALATGVPLYLVMRREARQKVEKPRLPGLLAAIVGVFCGGLGGYLVIAGINAGLDKSPPEYRDVEVLGLWEETSHYIFRDYKVEYRELASGEKREQLASPQRLNELVQLRLGAIEVHAGRLGFPWVRQVCPLIAVPVKADNPLPGFEIQMRNDKTGEVERGKVAFAIHLGADKLMSPSAQLFKRAQQAFAENLARRARQGTQPTTTKPE